MSTKAPSEKHLEDWIVANPEKFDPEVFIQDRIGLPSTIEYIIARQFKLPYGIADLIVKTPTNVSVIELKKGAIDWTALAQCIRYLHDLKSIMISVDINMHDEMPEYNRPWYILEHSVGGILCGHSIADKHLPMVAGSVGIWVLTYRYVEDEYIFSIERGYNNPDSGSHYIDCSYGAIGEAMKAVALTHVAHWTRRGENHD